MANTSAIDVTVVIIDFGLPDTISLLRVTQANPPESVLHVTLLPSRGCFLNSSQRHLFAHGCDGQSVPVHVILVPSRAHTLSEARRSTALPLFVSSYTNGSLSRPERYRLFFLSCTQPPRCLARSVLLRSQMPPRPNRHAIPAGSSAPTQARSTRRSPHPGCGMVSDRSLVTCVSPAEQRS